MNEFIRKDHIDLKYKSFDEVFFKLLDFLLNDSCLKKSVHDNFFELNFGQVMGQDLDFDINWLVVFHLGRYFDKAFKVINHNLFLTCESLAFFVGKVIEQGLFLIYEVK